jgi:hypothetical protein
MNHLPFILIFAALCLILIGLHAVLTDVASAPIPYSLTR